MAVCLPDTQDDTPSIPIKLTRVGVTGVKKLLQLERNNKRPIKTGANEPIATGRCWYRKNCFSNNFFLFNLFERNESFIYGSNRNTGKTAQRNL